MIRSKGEAGPVAVQRGDAHARPVGAPIRTGNPAARAMVGVGVGDIPVPHRPAERGW